jgi:hypothetical protein
MDKETHEYIRSWVQKAEHDLKNAKMMHSTNVIPAAILSGNPGFNSSKSWMPDRGIRA